jgi:adenosine deaminase CECR1
MGINCSIDKDDSGEHVEKDSQHSNHFLPRFSTRLARKSPSKRAANTTVDPLHRKAPRMATNRIRYHTVDKLDGVIDELLNKKSANGSSGSKATTSRGFDEEPSNPATLAQFTTQRALLLEREKVMGFDYQCEIDAEPYEVAANRVIQTVVEADQETIYGNEAGKREGYAGQQHPRVFGDHFLSNVDLIEKTKLFNIARKMPKGGHLHIHFNANLAPEFLIKIAAEMRQMFILSDIPLRPVVKEGESPGRHTDLDKCRIEFSILREGTQGNSLFEHFEPSTRDKPNRRWMKFDDFREEFGKLFKDVEGGVEQWLCRKLVFDEEETHNMMQTAAG